MEPREMAGLLRNTALIKVVDGGADYEFRIVGDAVVCAYEVTFRNDKLSDFENAAPIIAHTVGDFCDRVVDSGVPTAVRRKTGYDVSEANLVEAETVFLPLGPNDNAVDHLLAFSCYLLDSVVS